MNLKEARKVKDRIAEGELQAIMARERGDFETAVAIDNLLRALTLEYISTDQSSSSNPRHFAVCCLVAGTNGLLRLYDEQVCLCGVRESSHRGHGTDCPGTNGEPEDCTCGFAWSCGWFEVMA